MADILSDNGRVALEILENSPSLAIRIVEQGSFWKTLYITSNVRTYGYSREDFLEKGLSWAELIHPDDLPALRSIMASSEEQGSNSYHALYRVVKKNGQVVWVSDSSTTTRDENGNPLYTDCIISDYTRAQHSKERVEDNLRQQSVMTEILRGLYDSDSEYDRSFQIILERTGTYLAVSRVVLFADNEDHTTCTATYEWCNKDTPSMQNRPEAFALNYEDDLPEIACSLKETGMHAVNFGAIPPGCRAWFAKEGVVSAAMFSVDLPGERYGFLCFDECVQKRQWPPEALLFLQNISKIVSAALIRKMNEDAIQNIAFCDSLTGLKNRYRFDNHLEDAIQIAQKTSQKGYVLLIDMDDFKIVNDGYGHDYGDAMLVEVAAYFRGIFPEDKLFRFGGDEFMVLIDSDNATRMLHIIDSILTRARLPWDVLDKTFYCTLSIGVVRFPDGGDTSKEVVKNVDIAMYQAKKMGKNNYSIYSPALNNTSIQRAELEHRLREDIGNNFSGFMVYYQPLVNLQGEVIGVEALLRWMDSDGCIMLPGQFVPLAEYLGLIVPLGEFVLRTAAADCLAITHSHPGFMVSVNVSMRQFQRHDFVDMVRDVLCTSGISMNNVVLEVTEGLAVQDLPQMKRVLKKLRTMGLRVALDDFGTGYSSLSNMREIPLDIVKIDRSFIRDITTDAYAKTFIRLITDLSHSMGREVCVEGVENSQQLHYCTEYQVDSIQGFYFWRPMPAAKLQELMEKENPAAK